MHVNGNELGHCTRVITRQQKCFGRPDAQAAVSQKTPRQLAPPPLSQGSRQETETLKMTIIVYPLDFWQFVDSLWAS